MTIDSGILLKNQASCNFMLNYYITILFQQLKKTLNQFLNLLGQKKISKFACPFCLSYWMDQSSLEVLSLDVLINKNYLKNKFLARS